MTSPETSKIEALACLFAIVGTLMMHINQHREGLRLGTHIRYVIWAFASLVLLQQFVRGCPNNHMDRLMVVTQDAITRYVPCIVKLFQPILKYSLLFVLLKKCISLFQAVKLIQHTLE